MSGVQRTVSLIWDSVRACVFINILFNHLQIGLVRVAVAHFFPRGFLEFSLSFILRNSAFFAVLSLSLASHALRQEQSRERRAKRAGEVPGTRTGSLRSPTLTSTMRACSQAMLSLKKTSCKVWKSRLKHCERVNERTS